MNDIDHILASLKQQLQALPDYGQLQVHLKRHRGEYHNTDVVKISSTRFTDPDANVAATTMIFQLIKAIADARDTGNLTFNITFKSGQAEQMTVQDFRKI